jgi:hypothetical protein
MPKTEIDYSNTIIYKITCKDAGIKDVYVGHTTNFVQRKHAHKQSCINAKSTNHTCKLYKIIREHGGWKNWTMEIVNFFNCNDHYEARIKEQEYFILLNATLNSIEPMPKPKSSIKPLHSMLETPKVTQSSSGFCCEVCDFATGNYKDYKRHIGTPKHQNKIIMKDLVQQNDKFICKNCNKCYQARNGLWYHQQKCHPIIDTSNDVVIDKELVMRLLKENSELKTMMIDLQNKMMDVLKIVTNNSIHPI